MKFIPVFFDRIGVFVNNLIFLIAIQPINLFYSIVCDQEDFYWRQGTRSCVLPVRTRSVLIWIALLLIGNEQ